LPYGIVGGKLFGGFYHGQVTAELAQRILKGEKVRNIPVLTEPQTQYMFNYEQMQRFGISASNLPVESIIINKPSSFYEENLVLIWCVIVFIAFQMLIIISLIVNIAKRRNAEKELKISNQQLTASEQQLIASNQQLLANEQQLKAANQQLIASSESIIKSEKKYRLLADNSLDVIWKMDLKLVFTYVSPFIKNMMGYTVDEWIGTRLSQHASTKEFINMAKKALSAIKHYKKLKYLTFNTVMLRKDGTEIPVEITSKLLFNKKGLPIGLQGTTHDITERKQAEEALIQSELFRRRVFDSSKIPIIVMESTSFKFIDINPAAVKKYGFPSREASLGKTPLDVSAPVQYDGVPSSEKAVFYLEKALKEGSVTFEWLHRYPNGEFWDAEVHLLSFQSNDKTLIQFSLIDITERKQAEEALITSNENYQQVVSNITTVVWKADIGEGGTFENTYSSPVLDELLELPTGTMKNDWEKYFGYIKPEYLEQVNKAFKEAIISPGKQIDCEYEVLKGNGKIAWFHSKGRCFEKNGKLHVFGSTADITEHKQAEDNLRESETRYKSLYSMMRLMSDNLPDLIWAKDMEGKFLFVNEACSEILLDAEDTDEPIGKTDIYFAQRGLDSHPENPDYFTFGKTCTDSDQAVLDTKKPLRFDESGNVKGKFLFLDVYKAPFEDENGDIIGTVGCARVVTKERRVEKELQKSEEKYRLLTETASDSIFLHDMNGQILYANRAMIESIGYSYKELLEMSIQDIIPKDKLKQLFENQERRKNKDLSRSIFETEGVTKKGKRIPVEIASSPFIRDGKLTAIFVIARDITERKLAENQIKQDLKIKTALIQEIYHRTKNNMAVVSAMLSIQSRRSDNEFVKSTFKEINNKIQAMSLVHQKLYKAKDLSNINLKDYIEDLANLIMQSYGVLSQRIKMKFDLQDVKILIDSAVPLGLIINELVSNIFKHAFPENQEGEIFIRLFKEDDETINLELMDNGIGFPQNFNPRKDGSMGFASIFSIVENQLKGEISVKSENGLRWHIKIKDNLNKERV
ncbi:MAG: PAS domain S-box protein, partial [Candidatus Cloacimonetes bacterium]|nr:PAS domain S-box protein [Candidatus Cloacimonadota bacterium]